MVRVKGRGGNGEAMKKNCVVLFALLIVLGISSPAKAVLVNVTGTLTFQVSTWNPFYGDFNNGNPFQIDVDPVTGAFSIPASVYVPAGDAIIYSLPTGLWPLGPVTLTGAGNAAGSFGPGWGPLAPGVGPVQCTGGGSNVNNCVPGNGSAQFGGLMGLAVVAHLYSGWPTVTAPTTSMIPLLNLPLSMFGDYNNNVFSSTGPMSGWGNGWTTGQAYVTNNTLTNAYSNSNLATVTGNFWDGAYITEMGSTINLVTSAFIRQFGSTNIPVTAFMSFTIVPEPSTALMVGAGLLGLIVAGRRKRA